jgi:hypothetical protein
MIYKGDPNTDCTHRDRGALDFRRATNAGKPINASEHRPGRREMGLAPFENLWHLPAGQRAAIRTSTSTCVRHSFLVFVQLCWVSERQEPCLRDDHCHGGIYLQKHLQLRVPCPRTKLATTFARHGCTWGRVWCRGSSFQVYPLHCSTTSSFSDSGHRHRLLLYFLL